MGLTTEYRLEYLIWFAMKSRCQDPNNLRYADWGGRGITVCARWQTFRNFFDDMGPKPTPQHSIDRIDNDGPYSPENCRWATRLEQAVNRRNNHMVTFRGKTQHVYAWARELEIPRARLAMRLWRGWSMEEAALHRPWQRQQKHRARQT